MSKVSEVLHYYANQTQSSFNDIIHARNDTKGVYEKNIDYQTKHWVQSGQHFTHLEDPDDDDVKRPMNSFLLWAKIMRRKYATENPNLQNAEISKLLGKIWNSMSLTDKRPFVEKAEKLRIVHMKNYPNYRYAPKKRKDRKHSRMISPEVAAALHSTLFDVNNIINEQLSQDRNLKFDMKKYDCLNPKYAIPKNPKVKNERKSSSVKSEVKDLQSKKNYKQNNSTDDDNNNSKKEISYEKMTLHYKPDEENTIEVESCKNKQEAQCCTGESEKETCKVNEKKKYKDTKKVKETTYHTDKITYSNKTISACSDNFSDFVLPDLLQSLIDSPLHLSSHIIDDTTYIWSDISEIIGSELY